MKNGCFYFRRKNFLSLFSAKLLQIHFSEYATSFSDECVPVFECADRILVWLKIKAIERYPGSFGAVCYAKQGGSILLFSLCVKFKSMVKWKLLSSTFLWFCLELLIRATSVRVALSFEPVDANWDRLSRGYWLEQYSFFQLYFSASLLISLSINHATCHGKEKTSE